MIYTAYYSADGTDEQRREVERFISYRSGSQLIEEFVGDWEGAARHARMTKSDLLLSSVSAIPDACDAMSFMKRKENLIFCDMVGASTFAMHVMIAIEQHKRDTAAATTPQRKLIEQVLSQPVRVVEVDVATEMIHLDKLPDGTWRMIVTKGLMK